MKIVFLWAGWLSANIAGYYQVRTFYQPLPNAKPSLADYRTTIHWEPDIKTDAAGKATVSFYNAAPPTDVRIILQGITGNGEPVNTSASYKVGQQL